MGLPMESTSEEWKRCWGLCLLSIYRHIVLIDFVVLSYRNSIRNYSEKHLGSFVTDSLMPTS